MHIKRGIKFILHKRKAGDTKNLAVRMRVTLRGERPLDFPIGHNIDHEFWDADNQHAIGPTADEVNRTIDEYRSAMNEIFARYELLEKRIPALGEIKDLFNDMVGRKTSLTQKLLQDENDFFEIYDLFTAQVGKENQWTEDTYTKFNSLKKHFKNFSPQLTINSVDDEYLYGFIEYLQSKKAMQLTYKQANRGMKNTTIGKNVDFAKWFLRWAAKKKYYNGDSHNTFNPKLKGTSGDINELVFFSWEELMHLFNFDFMNTIFYERGEYGDFVRNKNGEKIERKLSSNTRKALDRIRDVLCFCCFTSLRHSDVYKLKRTEVKADSIRVVTRKTVDGLIIQLNKYSRAILEKYKDDTFRYNKALPVISLQKMNDGLKIMGQLVGFFDPYLIVYFVGKDRYEEVRPKWQLLTTHCGRRTFVVNSLTLGIPTEVVMKWTGHSDYESMKPYIKIVEKLKVREMERFDKV